MPRGPPNIVLLVVDTLREDYAGGLEALPGLGFRSYGKAIAPSSWTLPSHVSMLTGEYPSVHQVHEQKGKTSAELVPVSRQILSSRGTLVNMLRGLGYKTYCLTANPLISPLSGFDFDECHLYDAFGETQGEDMALLMVDSMLKRSAAWAKAKGLHAMPLAGARRVSITLKGLLKVQQIEKGSKNIIDHLSNHELEEPFFLFVNLMEAHEPYQFNEDLARVAPCIVGRPVEGVDWRRQYPTHAQVAAARGVRIASILVKQDPLFIVTSDHGQLLGENGRFGHGYFLDDEAIRVPLYIRAPSGMPPIDRGGEFVPLTDLHALMAGAARGDAVRLGSDSAFSESFGTYRPLSQVGELTPDLVASIFSTRVRILSGKGSVTVNLTSGQTEANDGALSIEEAEALAKTALGPAPRAKAEGGDSTADGVLMQRLRDLGYE